MFSRLALIGLLAIATSGIQSSVANAEIRWNASLDEARKASATYKVPLLIHFYGDHCPPCKRLEQRVLTKPEVIETLNSFFICVQVNGYQDRKTASDYNVHSWPTDVFVSPDGKVLYQGISPQDHVAYMKVLESVAVMNRDRNIMLAAQKKAQPTADTVAGTQLPGLNASNSQQAPNQAYRQTQPTSTANPYKPNVPSPVASNQYQPMTAAPNGTTVAVGPVNQKPQAIVGPSATANPSIPVGTMAQNQSSPTVPPPANGQPSIGISNRTSTGQLPPIDASRTNGLVGNSAVPPPPSVPQTNATLAASQAGVANPFTTASNVNPITIPNNTIAPVDQTSPVGAPTAGQGLMAQTQTTPQLPTSTNKVPASQVSFIARGGSENAIESSVKQNAAMDGYCPVALSKVKSWVKGDSKLAVKHRGQVYWLSSQEAVTQFMAKPDAFAPLLSGYDPEVLLRDGKLVMGSIQHGGVDPNSGQMMLFSSEENKEAFKADCNRKILAINYLLEQSGAK